MRCICCNKNLNDYESTAKHAITGVYLDTCRKCIADIGYPVMGNTSFDKDEDIDEEFIEEDLDESIDDEY